MGRFKVLGVEPAAHNYQQPHGMRQSRFTGPSRTRACALHDVQRNLPSFFVDTPGLHVQVSGWSGAQQLHAGEGGTSVRYTGMVDCFVRTLHEEGPRAFWKVPLPSPFPLPFSYTFLIPSLMPIRTEMLTGHADHCVEVVRIGARLPSAAAGQAVAGKAPAVWLGTAASLNICDLTATPIEHTTAQRCAAKEADCRRT